MIRLYAMLTRSLIGIFTLSIWLIGVVLANGFWSTLFAIFIPFWAWYLVAERVVARYLMAYL